MSKETAAKPTISTYLSTDLQALIYDTSTEGKRQALALELFTYFNTEVSGVPRKELFRLTVLEKAIGEKSGNVRRWIAGGLVGGKPYVPSAHTLNKLFIYLRSQGIDINAKNF